MKRRFFHTGRNRIFLVLFLSFLFVTLIPVALLSYIYNLSVSKTTAEVERNALRLLKQCQEQIESKLTLAENLVSDYAFDNEVSSFAAHSYARQSGDLASGVRRLSEKFTMNTTRLIEQADIVEIGLYAGRSRAVISRRSGYTRAETYFGGSVRSAERTAQELLDALRTESLCVRPAEEMTIYSYSAPAIAVSSPVFTRASRPMTDAFVFCYVGVSEIAETLNNLPVQESGMVCVADVDGRILFQTGAEERRFSAEAEIDLDERNYLILSDETAGGRKYAAYIPRAVAVEQANYITDTIVWVIAVGLLISLALAVYLAYLNAKPAAELHNMLRSHQQPDSVDADEPPVDYRFLKHAVGELIDTSQNLSENYRTYLSCARADFIHRVVNGSFAGVDEVEKRADMLQLSMDACFYSGLLVRYEGLEAPVSELDSHQFNELSGFLPVVEKAFPAQAGALRFFCDCEKPSELCVLALMDENDAETCADRLRAYVDGVAQALNREHHISLAYVCGGFTGDISRVGELFQNAQNVRGLKPEELNGLIFAARRAPDVSMLNYSLYNESRLIKAVAANQRPMVSALVRELVAENFSDDAGADRMNRFRQAMHLTVLRMVGGAEWSDEILQRAAFLLEPAAHPSAEETEAALQALLGEVMDRQERKNDTEDAALMEQVRGYIQANLADPSLALYNLAQEFRMPESTLYKFIRSESGMTFTALLEKMRMKHAVGLLISTDFTIDEIASLSGYNSAHAFRRVFKKVFDMLPTEYRDSTIGHDGE